MVIGCALSLLSNVFQNRVFTLSSEKSRSHSDIFVVVQDGTKYIRFLGLFRNCQKVKIFSFLNTAIVYCICRNVQK